MSRPIHALLPVFVLACAGCPGGGGKPGAGTGGGGGIQKIDATSLVKVITADDAKVLDPHVTSDGGNVKVINQVFETLIQVDSEDVGTLVPELAESWKVSDDAKTITFTVRSGVTFHDGTPLDAAACKLSLDRLRKSGFDLPQAPYSTMFDQVEELTAEGQTLTMKLSSPVAPVALRNVTMFCASIVSPKVLEESQKIAAEKGVDAASKYVTEHPVGTGAFKVDAFDPAAKVTRLVANADYWGGAPAIKTLVFQQVMDEATRFEYLRKGSDVVVVDDVPRQHWEGLKTEAAVTLKTWWSLNVCYLGVNGKHTATKEPEVRQAIQLAVERERVLQHYEGTARATYSLVAQPMPEYDPKLRPKGWSDDLAERRKQAKALLEKVGAVGREVTVYFPNQPRPYLPRPQDIADTIRQDLKEVGLEAKIQGEDKNKLFPGIPTGEYELVLIGWTTDNAHADNFYTPLADGADGEPSENNVSRVFHAGVHDKLLAAQQITDDAKRVAAYREIERLLQDEVHGYVPLANTQVAMAHSAKLEGVEVNEMGQYRFTKATLKN